MSEPRRSPEVPVEAVWVEERKEFRLSALVDGQPDGEVRWFRPDGSVACVSTYARGKGNGPYERYHETGEWSQRGQQLDGDRDGLCLWRRATGPTTEGTLPPSLPENVREARILFEDRLPAPNRYYDADGLEVQMDGAPLPPRPPTVDERAAMSDDGSQWYFGWGAQDMKTRRGTWRWWSRDGVLVQEQTFHNGRRIAELLSYPDGTPKIHSYKDARGWDLLQRCFDARGVEVDTRGTPIPPRPEALPASAVFDSMNTRWIDGLDLSSLPPMGLLTIYELDGTKDETLEFAGGHLRRRQRFNRDGSLLSEAANDERGQEILEVLHGRDGAIRHRIDRVFDGDDLVSIDIEADDGERVMRGRKAERGLAYEFFRGGALEARGTVLDDMAVGVWEFVEDARTHTVDFADEGRSASVDEDFGPSWLLGAALLERDTFPEVPALAQLEPVDWAACPSCYGEDVENFPRYLRALVSDVRAVRRSALARISSETLHQGTIYVATAKVIPFLLRLLDHPNASVGGLLGYLESVTAQAAKFRARALTWGDDSNDRVAVLGTLSALEDGFAYVAPFVESPEPSLVATAVTLASRAGEPGGALLERATRHANPLTAATAVYGLLDQQDDALTAEQVAPWLEHDDPIVRICAAIAAANNLGAAAPPRTVAVLGEAIDRADELSSRFSELPFAEGRLLAYAALGLARVRDEVAMARAVPLAKRLDDLDLFTLDTVSFSVLLLCFGDGTPPFAPGFVDVLAAIASCGRLENYANFSQSSSRFGLPSRASEYRALVEALRAAEDPEAHMASLLAVQEDEDEETDDDEEVDEDDE